jgi:hypothetical protein
MSVSVVNRTHSLSEAVSRCGPKSNIKLARRKALCKTRVNNPIAKRTVAAETWQYYLVGRLLNESGRVSAVYFTVTRGFHKNR